LNLKQNDLKISVSPTNLFELILKQKMMMMRVIYRVLQSWWVSNGL